MLTGCNSPTAFDVCSKSSAVERETTPSSNNSSFALSIVTLCLCATNISSAILPASKGKITRTDSNADFIFFTT